jgi:hypothetical protein
MQDLNNSLNKQKSPKRLAGDSSEKRGSFKYMIVTLTPDVNKNEIVKMQSFDNVQRLRDSLVFNNEKKLPQSSR